MKEIQECLQREIEMVNSVSERYFDRMYNNIGFTLTFYGVVISAGLNINILNKALEAKVVLVYLLPFVTYILGILFCKNVLMIEKAGYIQLRNELKFKLLFLENSKKFSIDGWTQLVKRKGLASVFSYGGVFTAFIVSPVICMSFYYYLYCTTVYINELMTISNLFPVVSYCVYFIVMVVLVYQIFKMRKDSRNIQLEHMIKGTLIYTRPYKRKREFKEIVRLHFQRRIRME